jgi:hypothetical protein
MKTNFKNIRLVFLATIALVSCNNDDEMANATISSRIYLITKDALTGKTQNLQQQEAEPSRHQQRVITINGNALTKKRKPCNRPIDITYVEILTKDPCWLLTNLPWDYGRWQTCHAKIWRIFIKASQGGVDLKLTLS